MTTFPFPVRDASIPAMSDPHPSSPFPAEPLSAEGVLRWYAAAGVDTAVGETPVDRTAAAAAAPSPLAAPGLDDLQAALEAFDACPLKRTATRLVFASGPATAPLMLVGEAPGADEDRTGIPFVGRAGQLLDRMLASIGWPRESVRITNVVPWRPPGNRNPTPEEITLCRPFIQRHIELVSPAVLVLLGGSAAEALLELRQGITRVRGTWHDLTLPGLSRPVPTLATFHPAYLLRAAAQKALSWRDFLAVKARLADLGAAPGV